MRLFGAARDSIARPIEAEFGRLLPGTTCHNVPQIVELRSRYFTPPYPAEAIAVPAKAVERV
jgi:hypothetical protein